MEFIRNTITSYRVYLVEIFSIFKANYYFKLFSKSVIIGSLCLIVIKLTFETTLFIRLLFLLIITGISMYYDVREKIKMPIKYILQKSLGFEFSASSRVDLLKFDLLDNYLFNKKKFLFFRTLFFEIQYFFKYILFLAYFYLTYIRIIIDVNPILYLIIYYHIFFIIIFFEKATILSYLGLFLIFSKLLVYIDEENTLNEIKAKIYHLELNKLILDLPLKVTSNNIFLFMYWNLKSLSYKKVTKFEIYYYIKSMLMIHNPEIIYILININNDEINFDFKDFQNKFSKITEGNTLIFTLYLGIMKNIPSNQLSKAELAYIQGMENHKIQVTQFKNISKEGKTTFQNYIEARTSSKNGILWETAYPLEQHSNEMKIKKGEYVGNHFVTTNLPRIYKEEGNSEDSILNYLLTLFDFNLAEVIKTQNNTLTEKEIKNKKDYLNIDNKPSVELEAFSEKALEGHLITRYDLMSQPSRSLIEISNDLRASGEEKDKLQIVQKKLTIRETELTKSVNEFKPTLGRDSSADNFSLMFHLKKALDKTSDLKKDILDKKFQDQGGVIHDGNIPSPIKKLGMKSNAASDNKDDVD